MTIWLRKMPGQKCRGKIPWVIFGIPPESVGSMLTSMRALWMVGMVAIASLLAPSGAWAVLLDPAFIETILTSSPELAGATGLAWAPDGSNRLFVTRKDGQIRIIKDGVLLATPFATVTPIYDASECGVIGLVFDPNFLANRFLYIFATVSGSEQQIIRYTADGDLGTAKTTVVPGLPTLGANHDGGGLGVGPDGKIFWGIGDQGPGVGVNADLASLAAKIGRANLDGSPPSDNPFVDGAGPNADHIWARGFRNPFTLTFQPATGLLWVNDVGAGYEQIFIVRRGDHAGWNTYEDNQPTGFIVPVIRYVTNGVYSRGILSTELSGAVRAGGRVTFGTDGAHHFRLGEKLSLTEMADPSFNGNVFVASLPSQSSFTAIQAGPDAVSGGGTATTNPLGGAVTGGTFYDATGFPAAYHGDFFFGDYNSGNIVRAAIDVSTNNITSVDQWGRGIAGAVDMALGPDGALYYVGVSSNAVFRAAYDATAQGLVVSPTNVWTTEGQSALVMVRLAMAPTVTTIVSAARSVGDDEVSVIVGGTLTFDGANWNIPQPVTIAAGRDLDSTDDIATISITSPGAAISPQAVTVHTRDDNSLSLLVSADALAIEEGRSEGFNVALSQQPSLPVTVTVTRSSGDSDVTVTSGATLTFTSASWSTPQTVVVSAGRDADGMDDTATISVVSSGVPSRSVSVYARDVDARAPFITSSPVVTAIVGAPYLYDVEASGLPQPVFSLDSVVTGMVIDPASGVITWKPVAAGSFAVTVRASNGVAPPDTQSFGIEAAPDMAPTCVLGSPQTGDVVSGTAAEFFGDASDDVGTVKAEFRIDGVLGYSDVATTGPYHFGGAVHGWNTTDLDDGPHKVSMTIYDTAGQICAAQADVTVANQHDGGVSDAGGAETPDATGGAKPVDSGCGCRTTSERGPQSGAMLVLLVVIFAVVVGRRRRRSVKRIA
jgi:MYXO-CTERM domain-containing protein